MQGAALLIHGGGPTQVINASLQGVVEECRRQTGVTALFGARFGIEGALAGDFVDLLRQEPARIASVGRTPGSTLGSSRAKMTPADYQRLFEILQSWDIRYLFLNGGNGSMYMARQIASTMAGPEAFELSAFPRRSITISWAPIILPATARPPGSSRAPCATSAKTSERF